ncbi:RNA-directed DNA polymerase, eukaryota, Reverse transcriptase zinc-binding domain protein [Artemisia annua]|uniref:RNA-directed DNA polymerase, eukaryota, Reverse transcriptase zinc-binding domain protein n=1 Tax=Artemisia annua TaxID=35608 RepID=A0A2U1LXP5_ARTAN|nr:RNA-directed DNA polymerase, eukaryota, Reverse transcriptase zinc-binding domain protein [Artemisia annua]
MEMDECMQQKSSEQSKEGHVNEKEKGNGVNIHDVNGGNAVNKESSGSKDSVVVNAPGQLLDKKLHVIPTEIDANGTEIVVFDDVMCQMGVGRMGFARVLVEMSATKEIPEWIEIVYRNGLQEEICRKKVKVEYDWYPPRCDTCCIFGHNDKTCGKKSHVDVNTKTKAANDNNEKNMSDGLEEVRYRKNGAHGNGRRQQFQNYGNGRKKPKPNVTSVSNKRNENSAVNMDGKKDKGKENVNVNEEGKKEKVKENYNVNMDEIKEKGKVRQSPKKAWHVQGELLEELKRSANKYSVLEMGLSTSDKQREIRNFIEEEALSICAVLETHLKKKKLNNVVDSIFDNWDWTSNMQYCDKGCRIVLGWNRMNIRLHVVHCGKQSMLCKIETIDGETKLFGTFVYAANGGSERRDLWKNLEIYKRIVGVEAWMLMGDLNYANQFWNKVKDKLGIQCDGMEWNEIVNWCAELCNGNTIVSVVRRIGLAASVYYIWQERNRRLFKGVQRSIDELISQFNETVKLRLLSLKVKPSVALAKVQNDWNITLDIIGRSHIANTNVEGCLDQAV